MTRIIKNRTLPEFCLALSVAILLFSFACRGASGQEELVAVRGRADAFLASLREGRWKEAAEFVLLDEVTQERMEISKDTEPEVRSGIIAKWLQRLYGRVKPGSVHSVRLDPKDKNLALIMYRHGDLDGFHMRFANGNWYYTLDWQPHPED